MAPARASAKGEGGIVDSLSHPLNFPPFSVDWVDGSRLVVTGGGGASRTGVPNGVWLYLVREACLDLDIYVCMCVYAGVLPSPSRRWLGVDLADKKTPPPSLSPQPSLQHTPL
jgi:hypothetical protein